MKKLVFFLVLTIGLFDPISNAQFSGDKKWSGGLNVAPVINNQFNVPTLLVNWNMNDNPSSWLRLQVGFNSNSYSLDRESTTNFQQFVGNSPLDSTIKTKPTNSWDLFFKIGWAHSHDLGNNFFFYYGSDIIYGHGQFNGGNVTEVVTEFGGPTNRQTTIIDRVDKNHYDRYGVETFGGFAYKLSPLLSVGFESSFGVTRYIKKTEWKVTSEFIQEFNPVENVTINSAKQKIDTLDWRLSPLSSFYLIVSF